MVLYTDRVVKRCRLPDGVFKLATIIDKEEALSFPRRVLPSHQPLHNLIATIVNDDHATSLRELHFNGAFIVIHHLEVVSSLNYSLVPANFSDAKLHTHIKEENKV